MWLISFLPLPIVSLIGYGFGWLLYALGRGKVVDRNLLLCFPDWTAKQRKSVAKSHFQRLARSFVELGVLCWQKKSRITDSVEIIDFHHLSKYEGKPVILLTPHFIGMNYGGAAVGEKVDVLAMYSANKDAVLDEVLRKARSRFGNPDLISKQQGIRTILRALKTCKPLVYLPDLDFGAKDSVFVPFFGIPAATITATSRLAKASGAAVIPMVIRQREWNKGYEVRFFEAWEHFPSGDEVADAIRMNQFIEERIKEMPDQYYWVHRRFGSRQPGTQNLYKQLKDKHYIPPKG